MRKATKFRLSFLAVAVCFYWFTSWFMPAELTSNTININALEWQLVIAATLIFFVVLPIFYWHLVIKVGEQPKWKMLLIFSLSSLVARYQYPEQIAQYFEFIMYLRYPLIAVLLIIELFLMYTVIKALWQARSLSGDPRVHSLIKYHDKLDNDELNKKQLEKLKTERDLAYTFSHEPASWFYAIPRFTRRHLAPIASIKLLSANPLHLLLISILLVTATVVSYVLLQDYSETLALVIATLVFYSYIMFIANYRISKHFSLYEMEQHLVINDAWWGMLVVENNNIKNITSVSQQPESDALVLGRGDANVVIELNKPALFYTSMGMMSDAVEKVYLNLDKPESLQSWFQTQILTSREAA